MELKLSQDILDSIDLSRYQKYDLDIGNKYFYLKGGKEHYRLLAYLSTLFHNKAMIDVGTNHGCSALALGYNQENRVYSFDVVNNRKESFSEEENITFKLRGDIEDYRGIAPSIVFMDADKSDGFEQELIDFLLPVLIDSESFLIMDDYHEYPVVQDCIHYLADQFPVHDLTEFGHYSGTHLVDFSKALEIVK